MSGSFPVDFFSERMNRISQRSAIQNLLGPNAQQSELDYLNKIRRREIDGYRDFKRIRNGKTRSISIPDETLERAQRAIANLLRFRVGSGTISEGAHAYIKNRSTITAARQHKNTVWAVKMDIKSFFDNVTEPMVLNALYAVCGSEEAKAYSKICTRVSFDYPAGLPKKYGRFRREIQIQLSENLHSQFPNLFRKRFFLDPARTRYVLPPKDLKRYVRLGGVPQHDGEAQDKDLDGLQKTRNGMRSVRKKMLKAINSRFLASVNKDELQKVHPVRPSQFRTRPKLGYLPQGSVTSGTLANMVMYEFDETLLRYCKRHKLRYTRYSDDIFISSDSSNYTKEFALKIISFTQQLCEYHGFTLNKEKTKILTPGSRKFMLGLLVDGEEPRLPAEVKERIKKAFWLLSRSSKEELSKIGDKHILNQMHFLPNKRKGSHRHPELSSNFLDSLRGWLCCCKVADKTFLTKLQKDLRNGKWPFQEIELQIFLTELVDSLLDESHYVSPERAKQPKFVFKKLNEIS